MFRLKILFYLKHYIVFMIATWARNIVSTISSDEPGLQRNLYMYLLGYFVFLGVLGLLFPIGIALGRRLKKHDAPIAYSFAFGICTVILIDATYNHRILSLVIIALFGVVLSLLPAKTLDKKTQKIKL